MDPVQILEATYDGWIPPEARRAAEALRDAERMARSAERRERAAQPAQPSAPAPAPLPRSDPRAAYQRSVDAAVKLLRHRGPLARITVTEVVAAGGDARVLRQRLQDVMTDALERYHAARAA